MRNRQVLTAAFLVVAALGVDAAGKPLFIVNEDNDHYFKKDAKFMTREALEAYVDNFAHGHVTHFFMCPSGQRASFDSKTVEPIWLGIDETAEPTTAMAQDGTHDRWAVNAKILFDAGIDPYDVWTKRCRMKGVSPWFTIRMNDMHGMGDGPKVRAKFRTTTFHRCRKDLWRRPESKPSDNYGLDGAFDYAKREVREYMKRHVLEIINRWSPDGIELDWMRNGRNLAIGRERADAHFITEFITGIRKELDAIGRRRGVKIQLCCRVPRDLKTARAVGLFVDDWVDAGLLDFLVPHSFLAADFDLPVDEWLEWSRSRCSPVCIIPGIDICAGDRKSVPFMLPEHYRGCVERFYSRGATGIYFFNLPYLTKTANVLYAEGIAPETIAEKPKSYLPGFKDFPSPHPEVYDLPELLRLSNGRPVGNKTQWENVRRNEILDVFMREVYGRCPCAKPARLSFSDAEPERLVLSGKATLKRVRVDYGDRCGDSSFMLTIVMPQHGGEDKPKFPVFLLIANRISMLDIESNADAKGYEWPIEKIIDRGYATVAFSCEDIARSDSWAFDNGAFSVCNKPYERTAESWGCVSAWAWGATLVMDWIETERLMDVERVAIVGHGDCGKAALVAAAIDDRFAMACVNEAGCGGTKLNHAELLMSGHYDQLLETRGNLFCGNFSRHAFCELKDCFDTHWLAALVAPRLLAIGSASDDEWSGPHGEFLTAKFSSPAWALYGEKGLVGTNFPEINSPMQNGSISYHVRGGNHGLTTYDWAVYLDFASLHGWSSPTSEK